MTMQIQSMEKFFASCGAFMSHKLVQEGDQFPSHHVRFNYTQGYAICYSRGGTSAVKYTWEFHLFEKEEIGEEEVV